MKKLILFLLPLFALAQNPTNFPYGIKNTVAPTDTTPAYFTTTQADGVHKKTPATLIAKSEELLKKQFLSTGLIKNGLISINADPTKYNITAGIGVISNFDDPENPVSTIVNFPAVTAKTPAYLTSGNITYIAINAGGSVVEQSTPFTTTQRRDLILLGAVIHSNLTNINVVNNISAPTNADTNQLHDFMEAIGALNLTGNKYTANGTNLSLDKSAGSIFKFGVNFATDWKKPHELSQSAGTALTFRYRTQTGTEGSDVTVLNPALYDLSGTLTTVPVNKFTIQTVTIFQTGLTRIQYGQNYYNSLEEAQAAIFTRNYVPESNIAQNGITRAYIILRNTTTSLLNASDAKIIEAQKFGGVASGGVALTLANIVTALGYTPENVSNKQNSLTIDGTGSKYPTVDAVNAALPKSYATIVYVNATSPNTATIFDDENPPITNDNALKLNIDNLYIGNDASTWVYNGSTYVTKVVPSTSNFYIEGTLTDAGNSKTANLQRSGGAFFGGALYSTQEIVSKKGASDTVLAGSNFRLFNNAGDAGNIFQLNASNGIDLWNYASNTWNKRFTFSSGGSLTANSFVKLGGTSSQFLKADGSMDGNSYLPLTGGTLSGTVDFNQNANFNQNALFYGVLFADDIRPNTGNTLTLLGGGANMLQVNGSGIFKNTTGAQTDITAANTIGGYISLSVTDNTTSEGLISYTNKLTITGGVVNVANLSGTGTRIVVADASGNLSTDSTVYAPLASPALTGTPTAPTATPGTNTTQIATTAFVQTAVAKRTFSINFSWATTSYGADASVYYVNRESTAITTPTFSTGNLTSGVPLPFNCKIIGITYSHNVLASTDLQMRVYKVTASTTAHAQVASKLISGHVNVYTPTTDYDTSATFNCATETVSIGFLNPTINTGSWRSPSITILFQEL